MKTSLVAAVLWMAATGGVSAATLYDCKMQGKQPTNWISDQIAIRHDDGTKTAKVSDAPILYFVGGPVDAKVASENGQRVTFTWTLSVTDGAGSSAKMQYRATWLKAAKRLDVSANALQYGQIWTRRGACAVSKVK